MESVTVTSSNPEKPFGGSGDVRPGVDSSVAALSPASPPSLSHPMAAVISFLSKMLAIAGAEGRKLGHDPTELFTRAVQPALWLIVFGGVFTHARAIPTGDIPYRDFMAPGILAQSVLFIAIFYGIAVIWERDLGIVHKMLVSPTPRMALVCGKALSAGLRALAQAVIVYIVALALGVRMNWSPWALAGVVCVIFIGAAIFSTLSLILACIVRTRERFMGIGQLMTMPLFFASNAIYPVAIMPRWLQITAHLNPLSYQVDALRKLMLAPAAVASIAGGSTIAGEFDLAIDFAVLVVALAIALMSGAWVYPRIVR
jgi:ABC-2 type transport system permease protein